MTLPSYYETQRKLYEERIQIAKIHEEKIKELKEKILKEEERIEQLLDESFRSDLSKATNKNEFYKEFIWVGLKFAPAHLRTIAEEGAVQETVFRGDWRYDVPSNTQNRMVGKSIVYEDCISGLVALIAFKNKSPNASEKKYLKETTELKESLEKIHQYSEEVKEKLKEKIDQTPDHYDLGRFGAIAEALSPDARKTTDEAIKAFHEVSKNIDKVSKSVAAGKSLKETTEILKTLKEERDKLQTLGDDRTKALAQLDETLATLNKLAECTEGPKREYNPRKFRQFLKEIFERLGEIATTTADKSLAREIEKIKRNIPDEKGKISAAQAKSILHKILDFLPNIYHAFTSYMNDMLINMKASYHQVKGYEDTLVAKAARGFKKPKGP